MGAPEVVGAVDMVAFVGSNYREADSWVYKRHCRTAPVWEQRYNLGSATHRKEAVGNILAGGSSSRRQMTSPLLRVIVQVRMPSRWW